MTEMELAPDHDEASPLVAWAAGARAAASVAASIAKTPFVPLALREQPKTRDADEIARAHAVTCANITAVVLTGTELGLQPMAALRALDMIQGTPAMKAITLRALVMSHGHDMWVEEQTPERAVCCGVRLGSDHVQQSVWTLDRARALGLLGKDNWKKQPQAMLVARATSECARLIGADVIMGVPYSVEELQDQDEPQPATPAVEPVTAEEIKGRVAAIQAARESSAIVAEEPAAKVATDADGCRRPGALRRALSR